MDSSVLQSAPSSSNHEDKDDNSMNVVSSKKIFFTGPYRRQEWSLPDSVMYYMAMNPKSAEIYQKLVKSCKYFYIKNPILVVSQLHYDEYGQKNWQISYGNKSLQVAYITSKLWITETLFVSCNISNQNILSSIIPKIYQCSAKRLYLWDQTVSFEDFCIVNQLAKEVHLSIVTVKNPDGSDVAFEKLVEASPEVKKIYYRHGNDLSNINYKTFSELAKIPHFTRLENVVICLVPETFDLNAFYLYMKINKITKFYLTFDDSLSDAYKNRLEGIIDKIIETKKHDYKPPYISFDGLNEEKRRKLSML
uniref:Uncharacterized protein n=1 Tax=Panagrolaimus sp. ES5 TaxID=591445 RepID=A0AC34FDF5_9BILA